MKALKTASIKEKLLLWYILGIIVPILLVGAISMLISVKIIRTQSIIQAESNFSYITRELDSFTGNVFEMSQDFLCSESIFDIISFDSPVTSHRDAEISDSMRRLLISNTEIQAVNIILGNRQWRSTLRENNIFGYGTAGYKEISKLASENNGQPCWYLSGVNSEISGIFFARSIHNPYTSEEKGLIIFEISREALDDIAAPANTSALGSVFILSGQNKYIAGSDINQLPELSSGAIHDINTKPGGMTKSKGDIIFFHSIAQPDWRIIYTINSYSIYRSSYLMMCCIIVLCLISLLLLILFAKYINTSITKPIRNLATQMSVWDERNTTDLPQNIPEDEIGALYKEFSRLTGRVHSLINQNYKSRIMLKESEIKMLQSQINPHFMFNTLEAINSMSLIYDVPEIGDMITALADILEHSIGRDDRLIMLSEEMHYIDSFIYIYNVRFPGKFRVIKNIDSRAMRVYLPRLLIQPVIENALTHGIIPSDRKCTLQISALVRGNDMYVTVRDDGAGIPKDELAELNRRFMRDDPSTEGSIGLINVNKRLKLYFGDEYHIKIDSEKDKFTSVTLRFCLDSLNSYKEEEDV